MLRDKKGLFQFPKTVVIPERGKRGGKKIYQLLGHEKLKEIFHFYCENPSLTIGAVARRHGLSNLAVVSCLFNYIVSDYVGSYNMLRKYRYPYIRDSFGSRHPETLQEFCFYVVLQGMMARVFVGKRMFSIINNTLRDGYITKPQWRYLILYTQNLWLYHANSVSYTLPNGQRIRKWFRDKKCYNIDDYRDELYGEIYEPEEEKLANVLAPIAVSGNSRINLPHHIHAIRRP